jgi:hypothetical protein
VACLVAGCGSKPASVSPVGFAPASRESFQQAAAATVPAGREIARIGWKADDGQLQLSGAGAVRLAPPDSLRLDVAATLGLGRSTLVIVGDSVVAQPAVAVDRILPDRFALWAALGIMRSPAGRLLYEMSSDGPATFWRTTDAAGTMTVFEIRDGALASVTRQQGTQAVSQLRIARGANGAVTRATLTDTPHHFRLQVDVNRIEPSEAFAPEIWQLRP